MGRLLRVRVALSQPWPSFQKEVPPEMAEAAPGRPVAELRPEVAGVALPSEALKDTAPVLEGLKVTSTHVRLGGSSCRSERW